MITTQKILGDTTPQQQPYRYGRRTDGRYSNVVFASLNQAKIDAIAAEADALGLNYEFSNNFGARSEITVEYNYNFINSGFAGSTTEADETWEIVPAKAMKHILESNNPLFLTALADAPGQVDDMKQRVAGNTISTLCDKDATTGQIVRQTWGSPAIPYSNAGMQIYRMLLDDPQTSIEIPAPVLTYTKIVTAQYIYPSDFADLGRVISTASLFSLYGVPAGLLFDLASLPSTDPAPEQIGGLGIYQVKQYGWLKNSPSVRQVAKRKWNITQTWDFGLWLINLYGNRL